MSRPGAASSTQIPDHGHKTASLKAIGGEEKQIACAESLGLGSQAPALCNCKLLLWGVREFGWEILQLVDELFALNHLQGVPLSRLHHLNFDKQ